MIVSEFIKWLGEAERQDRPRILCVRFGQHRGQAYVTNAVADMYVGLILECGGNCVTFGIAVERVAKEFVHGDREGNAKLPVLVKMGDGRMYHLTPRMASYDSSLPHHAPHTVVDLYPLE
jgi:hypothetical protein